MDKDTKQQKRSLKQNRSLHKYCTELAKELNDIGVTIPVLFNGVEASPTMESVKLLWQRFGEVKFGKKHTSDFTTSEINAIYDEINKHVSQWGIEMQFPSEELLDEYMNSYERNI